MEFLLSNFKTILIFAIVAIVVFSLFLFLKSKRRRKRLGFYINFFLYKIGVKDHMSRSVIARVHVKECYEPLVNLVEHNKIIIDETTIEQPVLLRKNVALKIYKVASKLPEGVFLKIYNTYRSRITIYNKWKDVVDEISKENPNMGRAEVLKLANFRLDNPKSLGGHETGGVVDVALCDANGKEFDYGTKYHEKSPANKTKSRHILKEHKINRKTLLKAMKSQGFVNNPKEWWHFSYGDTLWAAYRGKRFGAVYDAAEKDFENVGYVRIIKTNISAVNK